MKLELRVDAREHGLIGDLEEEEKRMVVRPLDIGDLMVVGVSDEKEEPLLMMERKTVKDLCASLRDGRYHDQRKRWLEFMKDYPRSRVSVWIEGDLVMCPDVEETMRSALFNSLLRLQSRHGILVHHVRNRAAFIKSLGMLMDKFEKEPYHLLPESTTTTTTITTTAEESCLKICLKKYKKTVTDEIDADTVWRGILSMLPGLSKVTADAIILVFPTLTAFMKKASEDRELLTIDIAAIQLGKKKIGKKTADKIVSWLSTV